jgi:hypothetical protein
VNTLTSIGDNDGFITKTDSARNYLWTKTWGGVHAETPYSVSIDPFDHAVVTGSYLSAYMVMDGDTLFNNQLTVGSSGDIFIARLHSAFFSGVNENPLKGNVSVYPNPADGEIHVQLPAGISGTVKTELMDVSGRVVFASELHQSNHMVIDSEQFSGGIYFLRISANGYNTVEKVVLK